MESKLWTFFSSILQVWVVSLETYATVIRLSSSVNTRVVVLDLAGSLNGSKNWRLHHLQTFPRPDQTRPYLMIVSSSPLLLSIVFVAAVGVPVVSLSAVCSTLTRSTVVSHTGDWSDVFASLVACSPYMSKTLSSRIMQNAVLGFQTHPLLPIMQNAVLGS